eukprot:TRINITY_DN15688_c0_g1_i1.p1 TRINITY_DN15688_c0_g1~~TRINITY_DN15688_c0_g1_i1.p1  ORF type:complete len:196 (-),score=43.33 TRINITY_DN15688_c0_g1_i1:91-678(-)
MGLPREAVVSTQSTGDFPQFTNLSNPLLNGAFTLTINYDYDSNSNIAIKAADANITIPYPLGFQPQGWPYILGFGRLSPLSLHYNGVTNPTISGSSVLNNACVAKTNTDKPPALVTSPSNQSSSKYSEAQKWSIGLGVGSAFLLIVIAILFYLAWRQGKRPLRQRDEDIVDPLKPDYGSQAINDIIDGNEELPRV